jgi:hypothetical protein
VLYIVVITIKILSTIANLRLNSGNDRFRSLESLLSSRRLPRTGTLKLSVIAPVDVTWFSLAGRTDRIEGAETRGLREYFTRGKKPKAGKKNHLIMSSVICIFLHILKG